MKARRARKSPLDLFPFAEPRFKTSPGTPGTSWREREQQWLNSRPRRQRATLDRLRETFAEGERSLTGWPEILDWLHVHGFRNREGGQVTERTVRGWSARLGCPVLRGCRAFPGRTLSSPPWTSNYLLLAWAVSLYRSGGLDMPRIERPTPTNSAARRAKYSSRKVEGSPSSHATSTRVLPTELARPRPIPPQHGEPPGPHSGV
jgi:hypothetical protein